MDHCSAIETIAEDYPEATFIIYGDFNLPEATRSNDEKSSKRRISKIF